MNALTFLHVFRSFSLFVSHDNRRRGDTAIGIDRWATQHVSVLMPAALVRCSVEVEGGGHTDLFGRFPFFFTLCFTWQSAAW